MTVALFLTEFQFQPLYFNYIFLLYLNLININSFNTLWHFSAKEYDNRLKILSRYGLNVKKISNIVTWYSESHRKYFKLASKRL